MTKITNKTDSTRISDDAVIAATGQGWDDWVSFLTKKTKAHATHKDIVAILNAEKISPWWAQTLAGHFEREALGREKHAMPDGYQASASKTINAGAMAIFESFSGGEAGWFPSGRIEASTINPPADLKDGQLLSALRGDWTGSAGGKIAVYLTRKTDCKSIITINHSQIADSKTCETLKTAWRSALAELKKTLET